MGRKNYRSNKKNQKKDQDIFSQSNGNKDYQEAKHYMPDKPEIKEYNCAISGKPIKNIYTAFAYEKDGQPASFDSVIQKVKKDNNIEEKTWFAYIGGGKFSKLEEKREEGKKILSMEDPIIYEDEFRNPEWRKKLSPGISRDYIPNPSSLDSLYTAEEEAKFPTLGASKMSYMPRTN